MIVKLTKIFLKEEISPKTNRPYTRMSIKCAEHGESWISGFKGKDNSAWKEGDEVEITITESDRKNKDGKPYLNFTVPKAEDLNIQEISKLKTQMSGLTLRLNLIEQKLGIKSASDYATLNNPVGNTAYDYPEDDITPDMIPF